MRYNYLLRLGTARARNPQRRTLSNAELVLLIHNHHTKGMKAHLAFEQGLRADNQVH